MSDRKAILADLQTATEQILGADAPMLNEEFTLDDDVIDSLDIIEIMMVIEEQYQFVVDGDDLGNISTIRQLIDLIEAKASRAAP